jgi:hypothetical protein
MNDPTDSEHPSSDARGLIGTRLPPAVLVIERGPVARFAEAVHDGARAYASADEARELGLPAVPVPPTFLFAGTHWGAFPELQPPVPPDTRSLLDLVTSLRSDGGMVLHGSQEFLYDAPVYVGDVLHTTGIVEDVDVKPGRDGRKGMTALRIRTEYRDEQGSLRVTAVATFLHKP